MSSKKQKGPSDLDMNRYIAAFYDPDSKDRQSIIGYVDNVVGKQLEREIIGHIVDNSGILQKTSGGIFSPTIYHIKERKFKTPDICCIERNFLGDVKRIKLEGKLNDSSIKTILQ